MRKITSVKILGDQVTIRWETREGDADVAHELKHGEDPAPELVAALAALHPHGVAALELPKDYGASMTVKGVTASYGDAGKAVVVVLSKKLKSGRATTMNTPALLEKVGDEQKASSFMSDDMAENVATLFAAAERYLDGERAQQVMEVVVEVVQ